MIDFKKYENNSMLDMSEGERELVFGRAAEAAEAFAALDGIDTDDVAPLVSVLDHKNILREDICEKRFTRDELLANAPEQADGCFIVPGTI